MTKPDDDCQITVEKDVPLPDKKNKQGGGWPFADMKVGDSFLCPNQNNIASGSRVAASRFRVLNPKFDFTIRQTEEGYRLWRTQ